MSMIFGEGFSIEEGEIKKLDILKMSHQSFGSLLLTLFLKIFKS